MHLHAGPPTSQGNLPWVTSVGITHLPFLPPHPHTVTGGGPTNLWVSGRMGYRWGYDGLGGPHVGTLHTKKPRGGSQQTNKVKN